MQRDPRIVRRDPDMDCLRLRMERNISENIAHRMDQTCGDIGRYDGDIKRPGELQVRHLAGQLVQQPLQIIVKRMPKIMAPRSMDHKPLFGKPLLRSFPNILGQSGGIVRIAGNFTRGAFG
jgi:hypothetical protein